MVVYNVSIEEVANAQDSVSAEVIRVTRPDQLPAALSQKNKPVVIDDPKMAARFKKLEVSQEARAWFVRVAIAALVAYGISRDFKIDFSWRLNWKVQTMEGKITLTPVERQ